MDTEGYVLAGLGMAISQTLSMVSDSAMAINLKFYDIDVKSVLQLHAILPP